ncbi:uncharacterized protein CDAR_432891 [Caerostris darwini]|uniref:C2H2-type domain-containing protein n=1 Tax=Caerostris darwini TaxID=1538125 RepID=A0AAV4QGV1_9ARAC|nr:uncharacterized protein CDAR_432891 [Caerostris darwini]
MAKDDDNRWANFVMNRMGNLTDLKWTKDSVFPKEELQEKFIDRKDMVDPNDQKRYVLPRIFPDDMKLYRFNPMFEEFYLVKCRTCETILTPSALHLHMETKHGLKEMERTVITSAPLTSEPIAHSSSSVSPCSSVIPTCGNESKWTSNTTTSNGAVINSPIRVKTSANIVKVKSQNSYSKVHKMTPYQNHKPNLHKANYVMPKNINRELSHPRALPELSPSIPSPSTNILPCTSSTFQTNEGFSSDGVKTDSNSPHNSPTASTSSNSRDKIQPLVLRRVVQTKETVSAEGRQSSEGTKGVARNKKDSSKGTYFMIVNTKSQQQITVSQHSRKQPDVVAADKNTVEQQTESLERERHDLISKLFIELKEVKDQLEVSSASKSKLESELLAVKKQLHEFKKVAEQNKLLYEKNSENRRQIQDLNERLGIIAANHSNLMEYSHLHGNCAMSASNFPDEWVTRHLISSEEQRSSFQKRLDDMEMDLKDLKQSTLLEKGAMEQKVQEYSRLLTTMKKRLDLQVFQNEELRQYKECLEGLLPIEVLNQVKNQLSGLHNEYQETIPAESNSESQPVAYAEELQSSTDDMDYETFQNQDTNDGQIFDQTNKDFF